MDNKRIKVKKIVEEYIKDFPSDIRVEGVFLFGSCATGKAGKESDVDLVVISPDFKKMAFIKRMELLSMLRKKKITRSVPMDIIGYTPDEFKDIGRESVIMRNAKKRGKMIYSNRRTATPKTTI